MGFRFTRLRKLLIADLLLLLIRRVGRQAEGISHSPNICKRLFLSPKCLLHSAFWKGANRRVAFQPPYDGNTVAQKNRLGHFLEDTEINLVMNVTFGTSISSSSSVLSLW